MRRALTILVLTAGLFTLGQALAGTTEPPPEAVSISLSTPKAAFGDRVQVFGAYEENRQDRDNRVFLGGTPFPPSLNLQQYEGTFLSPFREDTAEVRAGVRCELQPPN